MMLLFFIGFAAGSGIYLTGQKAFEQDTLDMPPQRVGNERFAVEMGYEVKKESVQGFRLDAQLPRVVSGYESADRINGEIVSDFWYVLEPDAGNAAQAFSGWKEPQITIRYDVEEQKDLFTITVTLILESEYMDQRQILTYIYQYDAKKQERIRSGAVMPMITIE